MGKGGVFEGLEVWKNEELRALQGTYPVIDLSFANVKEKDFAATSLRIGQLLAKQFEKFSFLRDSEVL